MSVQTRYLPCEVKIVEDISSTGYDGIVLVSGTEPGLDEPEPFKSVLKAASQIDAALGEVGAVLPINLPAKRLVYSPTGPLNLDYHDVRSFAEAATKGMNRALKAGIRCPLLLLLPDRRYENAMQVTLLGALQALYVPLEVREIGPDRCYKARQLGVYSIVSPTDLKRIVECVSIMESGRFVARDIGGSDPERMAAVRVEEYVTELFRGSNVSVEVISDRDALQRDYPLFSAVNRASCVVPHHAGRIIFLTYEPPDPASVEKTLLFVGKGVTYDTGGPDVKYDGHMAGMSRDKCGAAAVAGFMQVINLLKPKTLKAVAAMCVVRNNIGECAYVSDEVITARSGARVRVGNTDAEGRMAMADVLCYMKDVALRSVNPHIFTIATLTYHSVLTAGTGYCIVMDNAVARSLNLAQKLQASGEAIGNPFEISYIRKEDFEYHKGTAEGDDVLQAGNLSSARSQRGHQRPAAFLITASGLDKHGLESKQSLKYSHLDISGSIGTFPNTATGSPIPALANWFF